MHRNMRSCLVAASTAVLLGALELSPAPAVEKAPGEQPLVLTARKRVEDPAGSGAYRVAYEKLQWLPRRTAIIICDMWNVHWCRGATRRVAEVAPRMNKVVALARRKGVLIVHAPSGTMAHYAGHPARVRAREAPKAADLPSAIAGWCNGIPAEEKGRWPVDQSDGGCDCQPPCKTASPWTSQIGAIEIHDEDAISDSGTEIWNLFAARGIRNVIILGVHTNMCVIGRPFGLRNMARFGKNVVLMRDLTDTMYNSRMPPYVNHFTGTDLVVEHIEKYVCPSVTSTSLTGKAPFRFREDTRPRVVILSAESEYGAVRTMPRLAGFLLRKCGLQAQVLQGSTAKQGPERNGIPGMIALEDADLLVVFARRRALPRRDMDRLRKYVASGKPVVAFRTASHAFAARGKLPEGIEVWPEFDRDVLGCHYHDHFRGETRVEIAPGASGHPILDGLRGSHRVAETLYRSSPLAPSCKLLLRGRGVGETGAGRRAGDAAAELEQPVAWVNTAGGRRVFYASLGGETGAMREPWFRRLVVNAVFWALDRSVPEAARGETWK